MNLKGLIGLFSILCTAITDDELSILFLYSFFLFLFVFFIFFSAPNKCRIFSFLFIYFNN